MREYFVVEESEKKHLELVVNDYIEKGYCVVGGVSVIAVARKDSDTWYMYFQAMALP